MRKLLIAPLFLAVLIMAAFSQTDRFCHCTAPQIETETFSADEYQIADFLNGKRAEGFTQFSVYSRYDADFGVWIYDVTATRFVKR